MEILNQYVGARLRYDTQRMLNRWLQLNILVNSEFRAVITDFGSARYLGYKSEREMPNEAEAKTTNTEADAGSSSPRAEFNLFTKQLTVTGCLYTTRWAAPEILNGEESALRSDIWAFGWICFEVRVNVASRQTGGLTRGMTDHDKRFSIPRHP